MARIPRVFQRLFASLAGSQQIGQFGSLANNSPAYATDIATAMSQSNWLTGWYGAVVGANSPALQDFNAVPFVLCQQIAEILQDGVPPWDVNTTYFIGSLAAAATGICYVSLVDNNLGFATTNNSKWWPMTSPGSPVVVVGSAPYCTHATLAAAVADSNIGDNIDVLITQSLVLSTPTIISKRWRIRSLAGVTLSSSGGGAGGLDMRAEFAEIYNTRFSGFTTAITGNAAWEYGRVVFCNFNGCTTEVDDSNSPAGQKPVTLGNITE